jgi:putative transposon-encoded protein
MRHNALFNAVQRQQRQERLRTQFYWVAFCAASLLIASALAAWAQQQSTVMPFGNGYIINTPGKLPTTIQPFGNGSIINRPGQMPTTVQPFGNGLIINNPNRGLFD